MERFTISIDDELARDFDAWIAQRGYENRSEAVRDLVREKLGAQQLDGGGAKWCVATLSYVYDRSESTVAARVARWQHDHHDLVVSSSGAPLDHHDFLETVIARGKAASLQACASQLMAMRGVRHGNIHLVPLRPTVAHAHSGVDADRHGHRHLQPLS